MQKWTVGYGSRGEEQSRAVRKEYADRRELEKAAYNTVDEQKEYEDPDYYYGGIGRTRTSVERIVVQTPPPLPPPMKPTHIAIHNTNIGKKLIVGRDRHYFSIFLSRKLVPEAYGDSEQSLKNRREDEGELRMTADRLQSNNSARWKVACLSAGLTLLTVLMVATIISFFIYFNNSNQLKKQTFGVPDKSLNNLSSRRNDMEISPSHLLTLLITKRKVCIFEAGGGDEQKSRDAYLNDHIESARLVFHANLSHAGVPVHPLQFQRFARLLSIDNDCHVVIYDRGQMIWSTYAYWIFKLFGQKKVSLLAGGYLGWKTFQSRNNQYRTESGENNKGRQGDFLSSWNNSLIVTYDDVLLNTEIESFDVVDAQAKEEYLGIAQGSLYGHMKGARNVPVDAVYDWGLGQWKEITHLLSVFDNSALTLQRPIIVYCSTSLRSSMIWWALTRSGYSAKIYFGGWPEWVVRAPDQLKVLGAVTL